MKRFAFLVLVLISACATANNAENGGLPQIDPGFQVNEAGNQVVATGCFTSVEALGRETQNIFAQFMQRCLARVFMRDGKLVVEERISAKGVRFYCTKVVYSISDCADHERRSR